MNFFKFIPMFIINFCLIICVSATNNNNLNELNNIQPVTFDGMQVKAILFPIQETTIARRISSKIIKHNFKIGERFKKGEILANIDNVTFDLKTKKAKAALIEASKNEAYWRNRVKKEKEMYKNGVSDKATIAHAILQHEVCKSQLAVGLNNLQLAEIDLAECQIVAPFAGRVVEKIIRDGEHFNEREPLMTIIDDNKVLAVMHLPSKLRTKIKKNDPISLIIDETKTKYIGKVYTISAKIDPRSRTFEVKVVIDNKSGNLSSGMSAVLVQDDKSIFKQLDTEVAQNIQTSK